MLEARQLTCQRDERTLFNALSFRVEPGEMVQVAGQNGAGKTTLLRILAGLAQADEGEVFWQAQPLRRQRDLFHSDLLWIGHQPGIKTVLTPFENLTFFHADVAEAQRWDALEQIGLPGFEDLPVNQLSAGQQRRAALARLWLSAAKLWLLDEPFTALDATGIEKLTQRLRQHADAGGMVVLTSHQPLGCSVRQIHLQGCAQ
ncbi:cytochrome c biogenesis heme-transporting ATPase CcmA [Cedecea davisae]|uniref:Cytochrome c biogenesis heme-transporting ATPase CcmA n=1 Tax=Cedecea davisae TaxID=158484 RepID=A0ABS6DJ56_9ENTR|nr:cytochrome c biogenesis heme-transporting ATPase CcmA [Cedecea davisae]MBU4683248.1 cytochrome c biogenesis heme-transporting ATPase CcmA [Cedecea davisae]MBU4686712.1 cytochrome c biogenesis heme-transporting ATPase CcmA [Cedecea davisae]